MKKPSLSMAALFVVAALAMAGAHGPLAADPAKEGEMCGTIRGIPCAESLWCDLRAEACGGADLDGICVRPGDVCAEVHKPVCGCDGRTYGNDCQRIKAKVQKNHPGPCKGKDQTKPAKER